MTNIYLTLTLAFQTLYVLHVPPISGDVQKRDSASENPTGNARGVFADLQASRKFVVSYQRRAVRPVDMPYNVSTNHSRPVKETSMHVTAPADAD
jgi:hypothetical protein